MFAGVILKQNEVRWGTLVDGRYCSFSSFICPGRLDHVLSDQKAARELIAAIIDEIQQQSRMILDSLIIAAPALGVREQAVLDDILEATGVYYRVLSLSKAAAYGECCQRNWRGKQDDFLIICADKERYDLCAIEDVDGLCEVLASTRQQKMNFSVEEVQQSVLRIIERSPVKNFSQVFLSQDIPEPVLCSIQERLHLPCKRFGDELCLYGATMQVASLAGTIKQDGLLLDAVDWRITIGTIGLIDIDTTFPTSKTCEQIPSTAIRNGSAALSLVSDKDGEDPVLLKLPLGSVPPISSRGKTPDIGAWIDNRGQLDIELTSEGKTKHITWQEIRGQIIQSISRSKSQLTGQKTFQSEPVKDERRQKTGQLSQKKPPVCPMKPDDSGRYIFISYAHKNKDSILPIIRRMQDDGFRVWYDEGIHPGTEWPEIIASHVERCAFFLPFLTKEYLESENCKRELHFAGDMNKPRSLIFLEKVQLTSGMRMQHGLSHSLMVYNFQSIEELYPRLYESEEILLTRK